ncbi:MAG TPA: hypothetical protein VHR88_03460 [Solirubrobacteraceae bacterium]|jgi:hypothetical protein|nr:hypothetical protein [Solirubrobacteraceae bacterium]
MADLDRIAALLSEVSETHHTVYRITDGEDADWATFYADWLVRLSELGDLLGTTPVRSELTWLLVGLDRGYAQQGSGEPWPHWYATRLAEHFASGSKAKR